MPSSSNRRALRGGLAALLVLAALAMLPALANAATFNVNTTADNPPAPGECLGVAGDCSLRQAVDAANTAGGANTIVVPAGTYDLTIEAAAGDGIEDGDLNVADEALTIQGAGARHTTVDAASIEDRIFDVEPGAGVTLAGLTVTGGRTEDNGGGIFSDDAELNLFGVAVVANESYGPGEGGGLHAEHGAVHVVDSVFSSNRNSGDGGAIFATGVEELVIEDSTLSGNVVDTALYPSAPIWGAYGGAIEAYGEHLVLKNATISGNQIIDGNGGEGGLGAALRTAPYTFEVVNTIIANNTATEVQMSGQCDNTLGSLGHNLETQEPSGELRCFEEPSDLIANPLLAPLGNNGGETDTAALSPGSPAIDTGDSALCLPTDQRGVARPVGNGCDIGAYEVVPPAAVVAPVATQPAVVAVPRGRFAIKKLRRLPHRGTAKLGLSFSTAGQVKITGKGVKTVSKTVPAGLRYLPLVPKGALKTQLRKSGKAKTKVKIVFRDAAGNVLTKQRAVGFRLKPS